MASPAETPPPARFTLLRSFSLLAFLSIGLFALILAALVSRFIAQRMLDRDGSLTRDFVNSVAILENVTRIFEDYRTGASRPGTEQFFQHLASMPDVIRANVYTPDKLLLWSSDPTLKGQRFGDNEELDEALAGHFVAKLENEEEDENKAKSEHAHLQRSEAFIENYVPLLAATDHHVLGVVEFYRKPLPLLAAIDAGRKLVWSVCLGGAAVLYLTLFWVVRRGDRIMHRQQQLIAQAQTMNSLGELASMVAHNVRNPMASIRSTAELALEAGSLDREAAGDIVEQVDRIEQSLRQLLAYATPAEAHSGQADLITLAGRAGQEASRQPGIQVQVISENYLPMVRADPVLLEQAIHSIVHNAVDAMPEGGRLTLRTRMAVDNNQVQLHIEDTGKGIGQDSLARVFDAFYTTKSKGMGLGLPLARSIVRRYDGDIEIESLPGLGTRVAISLPAV